MGRFQDENGRLTHAQRKRAPRAAAAATATLLLLWLRGGLPPWLDVDVALDGVLAVEETQETARREAVDLVSIVGSGAALGAYPRPWRLNIS